VDRFERTDERVGAVRMIRESVAHHIIMSTPSELGKLIDNLTDQAQRKCDLETNIKILQNQIKGFNTDITAMQHKEELLNRQVPDTKKDIMKQKLVNAALQGSIVEQKSLTVSMHSNLETMEASISMTIEQIEQEKHVHAAHVNDTSLVFNQSNSMMDIFLNQLPQ